MIDLNAILAEALPSSLPPDALEQLAQIAYAELERRTGERIYDTFTLPALKAFEEALDIGDDELTLQILQAECPQYAQIVKEEVERIVSETVVRISALVIDGETG